MVDVWTEVNELLEARPELEEDFDRMVAVDRDQSSWEFEDVPIDSGAFGEVVSRGIVENTEDGAYRLADRAAVESVLEGDSEPEKSEKRTGDLPEKLRRKLAITITGREAGALLAALAVIVGFRVVAFREVFRGNRPVFPANDPYRYRYWVEQLLAASTGPFDLSPIVGVTPQFASGEEMMVVTLWFASELLGGTPSTADLVLTWYPVVSAVLTGVVVYATVERVVDDVRPALAGVMLLAVTPIHAVRTGIGFADHHAFDYLLVALVAYLVVVAVDRDRSIEWPLVGALGVAVTMLALAWDASPLLLAPLGLYLALTGISGVRGEAHLIRTNGTVLLGIAVAGLLTYLTHALLGWKKLFVALSPALLFVAGTVVLALSEIVRRRGGKPRTAVVAASVSGVIGLLVLWTMPVFGPALEYGTSYLLGTEGLSETRSLFASSLGGLFAPVLFFGFSLFLALPVAVRASMRAYRDHQPVWLVLLAYAGYFSILSLEQVRFGAQLGIFAAILGGIGFVRLAAWVELTQPLAAVADDAGTRNRRVESDGPTGEDRLELPGRRDLLRLGGLWTAVGGAGMLLTPLQHFQLMKSDGQVATARWMQRYAERKQWSFPESYVFSNQNQNLFYNYFVSGVSRRYTYSRRNYAPFATATDASSWYERLRDRAGFVVTHDTEVPNASSSTTDESGAGGLTNVRRLHERDGSGTAHYRAMWGAEDGSTKVFTLVPGARITGPAAPGTEISLSRNLDLGRTTGTYERTATANDAGIYDLRVPQPGTYDVGGTTRTVPEEAVTGGGVVSLFSGEGAAYWSFDHGTGDVAYDRVGGYHADLRGDVAWAPGVAGTGLDMSGGGYAHASVPAAPTATIALWARPPAADDWANAAFQHVIVSHRGSVLVAREDGVFSASLPGLFDGFQRFGEFEPDKWTHVVLTVGDEKWAAYQDGTLVRSGDQPAGEFDWGAWLRFGGVKAEQYEAGYRGALDEVRVYHRALSRDEVANLYTERAP